MPFTYTGRITHLQAGDDARTIVLGRGYRMIQEADIVVDTEGRLIKNRYGALPDTVDMPVAKRKSAWLSSLIKLVLRLS